MGTLRFETTRRHVPLTKSPDTVKSRSSPKQSNCCETSHRCTKEQENAHRPEPSRLRLDHIEARAIFVPHALNISQRRYRRRGVALLRLLFNPLQPRPSHDQRHHRNRQPNAEIFPETDLGHGMTWSQKHRKWD